MFYSRPAIVCALISLAGLSCAKAPAAPPARYAVLRFENLTGDASLEWVGRAASEVLSRSLAGAPGGGVLDASSLSRVAGSLGFRATSAPGLSSEYAQALAAGATRIVSGYVERDGGRLRIAATEEDPGTGKTLHQAAAIGTAALPALQDLARQLSPGARPYLTRVPDALRLYATGLDENTAAAFSDLGNAVAADPDYGPPRVALIGLNMARGNREEALRLIAEARGRKLDPLAAANVDLAQATIDNDRDARIAALHRISTLSPADTVLLRTVAENESAVGQFGAAAADWLKLATVVPNDTNAWNQLGYNRAWNGDYPGALQAFNEYAKLVPADPNPLDSAGDVQYLYRRFNEAAASYKAADAKGPGALNGGELEKAAWAEFRAGDKAGADALFERFRAAREKAAPNSGMALIRADWLYRTGREKEAMAMLRKEADASATPAARAPLMAQLAIWDLLAGNRSEAARDAAGTGQPTSAGLVTIRLAAMPSASTAEWEARALKMLPAPNMAGLRTGALAYALLLDGRKEAAMPYFEKLAAAGPANDFFLRAILARLKSEKPKFEPTPDPNRVNEFAAVADKL